MNCSNCDAELSVGTDTHLLNCAFCGAVQRNPDAAERRPIDDLLDQVFAETGDAAFECRDQTPAPAASSTIGAVDGRRYATDEPAAPEVKQALRDTRRALNDLFGDEVHTGPVAHAPAPSATATAVISDPSLALEPAVAPAHTMSAPVPFVEPDLPRRSTRPQVVLGGDAGENPEWTRYLIPMLLVALLCGAGVAGLAALILG